MSCLDTSTRRTHR